jgi:carbamoyl-phosphate synthase large subunit
MKKKSIIVTAVGGRSVGSGIVRALKSTDRWNIIATDADPFSWGLYVADQKAILPLAKDPDFISAMIQLCEKVGAEAIIPGSEPEVEVLANNGHLLPVPVICNRAELIPLMLDKFIAAKKIAELGLPAIETFPIDRWREVYKYDFPFIIKPTVSTGGSRGLHIVFSEEEILHLLPHLPQAGRYCIQPYIGSSDEEYTVGILSDFDGKIIDSIVMRRMLLGLSLLDSRKRDNIDYSISTGYSQGYFIRDKVIQDFCETLAIKLENRGPLNIQLRKIGNEIYVFEIHPRFSGTVTMRADVGFNEPDILLRNVLHGEKFGRLNYTSDVAVIRALEHIVVPVSEMATKAEFRS